MGSSSTTYQSEEVSQPQTQQSMHAHLPLIVISSLLAGCTWADWNKDFVVPYHKLNPPPFRLVSLGMTKQQVVQHLGEPDQLVGAKMVNNQLTEIWEYHRIEAVAGPDQIAERFQLEFVNGKLSSYDSSGDFRSQINVRY
jgi:hypothetical protein